MKQRKSAPDLPAQYMSQAFSAFKKFDADKYKFSLSSIIVAQMYAYL